MMMAIASSIALFCFFVLWGFRPLFKKLIKIPKPLLKHSFVEDQKLNMHTMEASSKSGPMTSAIYRPVASSSPISRYLLCTRSAQVQLMAEYKDGVDAAHYFVYCYDHNHRLIEVLQIAETVEGKYSKPITLSDRTTSINIVPWDEEAALSFRKQYIKEVMLLIYDTLTVFMSLFGLSFWTAFIVGGNLVASYFDWSKMVLNAVLVLILTAIYYIMNLSRVKKRIPEIIGGSM